MAHRDDVKLSSSPKKAQIDPKNRHLRKRFQRKPANTNLKIQLYGYYI